MSTRKRTRYGTLTFDQIKAGASQLDTVLVENLLGDGKTYQFKCKKLTVRRLHEFERDVDEILTLKKRTQLDSDHDDYITLDDIEEMVEETKPALALIVEFYCNDDGTQLFTREQVEEISSDSCVLLIEALQDSGSRKSTGKASGRRGRRR